MASSQEENIDADADFDEETDDDVQDNAGPEIKMKTCIWPSCRKKVVAGLGKDGLPHRTCSPEHLRQARMCFRSKMKSDGRVLRVGVRQKIHPSRLVGRSRTNLGHRLAECYDELEKRHIRWKQVQDIQRSPRDTSTILKNSA